MDKKRGNVVFRHPPSYYILRTCFSMGLNAPVLVEQGFHLQKVLVLIVPEGTLKTNIQQFQVGDSKVIDENMDIRSIQKVIQNAGHAFLIYPFSGRKKSTEILDSLCMAVKTGTVGGKEFSSTPLVIAETSFFQNDMERFFIANIADDLYPQKMFMKEVVPADNKLSVSIDRIRALKEQEGDKMELMMKAATWFIYPQLGDTAEFKHYGEVISKMMSDNASFEAVDSYPDLFVSRLADWTEQHEFQDVYELPVNESFMERADSCLFYDKGEQGPRYVYMSDAFFKNVIGNASTITGINAVKKSLQDSGCLITENTNTYTIKMYFGNRSKKLSKPMLRFDSHSLGTVNGMHLVDVCAMRKHYEEENNNDEEN